MADFEAIAWQSDCMGQRANDEFLAAEADHLLGNPSDLWSSLMAVYYEQDDEDCGDGVSFLSDGIESALFDAGFVVHWDGGVFIYRQSDIPEDFDWEAMSA